MKLDAVVTAAMAGLDSGKAEFRIGLAKASPPGYSSTS